MPDALPHGKSGRGDDGEFILTRVEVTARSANPEKTKANSHRPELGQWWRIGPFAGATKKEAFEKDFGPEPNVDLQATYKDGELKWQEISDFKDEEVNPLKGTNAVFYFHRTLRVDRAQRNGLRFGSGGGLKVWLNGRLIHSSDTSRKAGADQDKVIARLVPGENKLLVKVTSTGEQGGSPSG